MKICFKNSGFTFTVLAFLLAFLSVSGQTGPDRQLGTYQFPKIKSGITLPVTIPLAGISSMINASVKDLIYEDDSYTDNQNDQFKVKVWKTRPIRLVGGTNNNILIEVPLKIWAEKGIGTLGIYTYQNTTFETVMSFNMSLQFRNNWTLGTKTQPNGFRWVVKPVLDYGRIKIPITSLVEKSLKEQQEKFCETIDSQVAGQLNLQQYVMMAWNAFSQPFNISEEYHTWLKISPVNVTTTPLQFFANQINTNIGVTVYSETFTGEKPQSAPLIRTVPDFNSTPSLADRFLLQTTANIPYASATEMARNLFLNKEYDVRGSSVKIKNVQVYNAEDRVMIEAETEGYIKGKVFISGIPVYDPDKHKIILTGTKFNLRTPNILQKTATLLFKGQIIKTIEKEYGIPTQEMETTARKSIEQAFNTEYYKGIKMSGKVINLRPGIILLSPSGMTAVIDISASLQLTINGI